MKFIVETVCASPPTGSIKVKPHVRTVIIVCACAHSSSLLHLFSIFDFFTHHLMPYSCIAACHLLQSTFGSFLFFAPFSTCSKYVMAYKHYACVCVQKSRIIHLSKHKREIILQRLQKLYFTKKKRRNMLYSGMVYAIYIHPSRVQRIFCSFALYHRRFDYSLAILMSLANKRVKRVRKRAAA